jgi:hypothetical protein
MSFDPNIPVNGTPNNADPVRANFNALKAITDDLQAQINALTPHYAASGFPDPTANGVLTQVGTINGQPLYQSAGGAYFGWMGTPPGWWAVQPGDPRVSGFNGVYYREDSSLTGQYVYGGTSTPAGTVA